MVIASLLLALAPPQVAPGPVEVEVESVGTVEVPAQGYRLSAFFATRQLPFPGSPAPIPADVVRRAIADATNIGVVKTPVCEEEAKLGFIGNEAVGGPAPEESGEADGLEAFTPFDGTYATLDQAQRAMVRLKAAGGQMAVGPQGVLFTCDAANRAAAASAVKTSQLKAADYAALLGLKVAGIRRLSDRQSNAWGALMARTMQSRQKTTAQDKVQVTATVTVTYLLER